MTKKNLRTPSNRVKHWLLLGFEACGQYPVTLEVIVAQFMFCVHTGKTGLGANMRKQACTEIMKYVPISFVSQDMHTYHLNQAAEGFSPYTNLPVDAKTILRIHHCTRDYGKIYVRGDMHLSKNQESYYQRQCG